MRENIAEFGRALTGKLRRARGRVAQQDVCTRSDEPRHDRNVHVQMVRCLCHRLTLVELFAGRVHRKVLSTSIKRAQQTPNSERYDDGQDKHVSQVQGRQHVSRLRFTSLRRRAGSVTNTRTSAGV